MEKQEGKKKGGGGGSLKSGVSLEQLGPCLEKLIEACKKSRSSGDYLPTLLKISEGLLERIYLETPEASVAAELDIFQFQRAAYLKHGPVTNVGVLLNKEKTPDGYTRIGHSVGSQVANLNKGNSGGAVHLCVQRGHGTVDESGQAVAPLGSLTVFSPTAGEEPPFGFTTVRTSVGGGDAMLSHPGKGNGAVYLTTWRTPKDPERAFPAKSEVCRVAGKLGFDTSGCAGAESKEPASDTNDTKPNAESKAQPAVPGGVYPVIIDVGVVFPERNETVPSGWHEVNRTPFAVVANVNAGSKGETTRLCFRTCVAPIMRRYQVVLEQQEVLQREMDAWVKRQAGRKHSASSPPPGVPPVLKCEKVVVEAVAIITAMLYSCDQALISAALEAFKLLPTRVVRPCLLNVFTQALSVATRVFLVHFEPKHHEGVLQFMIYLFRTFLRKGMSLDSVIMLFEAFFMTRHEDKKLGTSKRVLDYLMGHCDGCQPCQCQPLARGEPFRYYAQKELRKRKKRGGNGKSEDLQLPPPAAICVRCTGKRLWGQGKPSSKSFVRALILAPVVEQVVAAHAMERDVALFQRHPDIGPEFRQHCGEICRLLFGDGVDFLELSNPKNRSAAQEYASIERRRHRFTRTLDVRHMILRELDPAYLAVEEEMAERKRKDAARARKALAYQERERVEKLKEEGGEAAVEAHRLAREKEEQKKKAERAKAEKEALARQQQEKPVKFFDPFTHASFARTHPLLFTTSPAHTHPFLVQPVLGREERAVAAVALLCAKMAAEPVPVAATRAGNLPVHQQTSEVLKRKVHGLQLLLHILKYSGAFFRRSPATVFLLRRFIFPALLSCCAVNNLAPFKVTLLCFVELWEHYMSELLLELGIFLDKVALELLRNPLCLASQKANIFEVLRHVLKTPEAVVHVFYNFDNHAKNWKLFQRLVVSMCELAEGELPQFSIEKRLNGGGVYLTSSLGYSADGEDSDEGKLSQYRKALQLAVHGGDQESDSSSEGKQGGEETHHRRGMTSYTGSITATINGETGVAQQLPMTPFAVRNADAVRRQSIALLVSVLRSLLGWVDSREQLEAKKAAEGDAGLTSSGFPKSRLKEVKRRRKRMSTWSIRHDRQKEDQKVVEHALHLARTEKLKNALKYLKLANPGLLGPKQLARFFFSNNAHFDKAEVGDFLSGSDDGFIPKRDYEALRQAYLTHIDFTGLSFDNALRLYLCDSGFRLPGEAQRIDRLLSAFCKAFVRDNAGVFKSHQGAFVVAFALVMLNTELHDPRLKAGTSKRQPMTLSQFISNLRGVDDGADFSRAFLETMYSNIKASAIEWKENAGPERSGDGQTSNGKNNKFAGDPFREQNKSFELIVRRAQAAAKANSAFTQSFNRTNSADLVKAIFELCNFRFLSALTHVAAHSMHVDTIHLCLDGLAYGCCLAMKLGFVNERKAFVRALAAFSYTESRRSEAAHDEISAGIERGEHLQLDWVRALNFAASNNPDKACAKVYATVELCKDSVAEYRRRAVMRRLQQEFGSEIALTANPDREFVRRGELTKVSISNSTSAKYHFFLFNDILVYAKEGLQSRFNIHRVLQLALCRIEDFAVTSGENTTTNTRADPAVSFQLCSPQKSFVIKCPSAKSKQQWLDALLCGLELLAARRTQFLVGEKTNDEERKGRTPSLPTPSLPTSTSPVNGNASKSPAHHRSAGSRTSVFSRSRASICTFADLNFLVNKGVLSRNLEQGSPPDERKATTNTSSLRRGAQTAHQTLRRLSAFAFDAQGSEQAVSEGKSRKSGGSSPPHCKLCLRTFSTFTRRKHTCPYCERHVCADCMARKARIPKPDEKLVNGVSSSGKMRKVCDSCYAVLSGEIREDTPLYRIVGGDS